MSEQPEQEDLRFNVLNHVMVPVHELVPEDDVPAIMAKYGIQPEQLPKIRSSDPALRVAAEMAGISAREPEFEQKINGRVVRVTRESKTAGHHVAFRLVVQSL